MAIQRANRPKGYEGGLCRGTVGDFGLDHFTKTEKKGRDVIETEVESYRLWIEIDGTVRGINTSIWLGSRVNDAPIETRGRTGPKQERIYNRLTTVALKLALVTEEELSTIDDARIAKLEEDFTRMNGKRVEFKAGRNDKGYMEIDPTTLRLLDEE